MAAAMYGGVKGCLEEIALSDSLETIGADYCLLLLLLACSGNLVMETFKWKFSYK